MDTANATVSEDPVGEQLDSEIASLQAQISALKVQRSLQVATILSSRATKSTLARLRATQRSNNATQNPKQPQTSLSPEDNDADPLLTTAHNHLKHKQENLYRVCGSITTFRIRDPDPNAVDDGNVLGIRIDVSNNGKFIRPYYVMLNKPFPKSQLFRVHRHTVPPCIPLAHLADRFLPTDKGATPMSGTKPPGAKKQDLRKFVRALRREVVAYHNRLTAIKSLRKEFKLDEKASKKGKSREKVISDISASDAEAKQVRIEWVDGKVGSCAVDDKGNVLKCVVIGEEGRDRETERAVMRGGGRIEQIGERLREGIY